MGYFTRSDLSYYYGLADAFTLCDRYHCSALSSTAPNRLYLMTGTIDPEGNNGMRVSTRAASAAKPRSTPAALTYVTNDAKMPAPGVRRHLGSGWPMADRPS